MFLSTTPAPCSTLIPAVELIAAAVDNVIDASGVGGSTRRADTERRPEIGEFSKQIVVRSYAILGHLPVCEHGHEGITGVVGECPSTARKGCWSGGIIGHYLRQQRARYLRCFFLRVPTRMLQRVRKDRNETSIV